MSKLTPKYEELQSIYDISNEFYELFLGPTMGYTCGYFEREDMTGDEAQIAKFDLALGKLGLEPGMTLLDVGCGWGAGMARAIEKYDVNVIGLTLSGEQREYAIEKLSKIPTERNVEVRLQGWEEFNDKVDRIVSIGAFEHFGFERYPAFFETAYNALPDDGIMLLHNITGFDLRQGQKLGLHMTFEDARFARFIMTEIFPGGRLPSVSMEEEKAKEAGFTVAGFTRSARTTSGRSRSGPMRSKPTRTRPSRSRAKRFTTATTSTSTAARNTSRRATSACISSRCRSSHRNIFGGLSDPSSLVRRIGREWNRGFPLADAGR